MLLGLNLVRLTHDATDRWWYRTYEAQGTPSLKDLRALGLYSTMCTADGSITDRGKLENCRNDSALLWVFGRGGLEMASGLEILSGLQGASPSTTLLLDIRTSALEHGHPRVSMYILLPAILIATLLMKRGTRKLISFHSFLS